MKTIILGFIMLGFVGAAFALPFVPAKPVELDNRIRTLTAKFEAFQSRPEVAIPAETLRNAQGIILMDSTKAGFLFAYQGGGGVAIVKDMHQGVWSPVAFMGASEASFGFLAGAEKNFYVFLLMTPEATHRLAERKFKFGGEASGTLGNASLGITPNLLTPNDPAVLLYDEKRGLYAGASVRAGTLSPDDKANSIYYGRDVTMSGILFDHQVQTTDAAAQLAKKLNSYSFPQGVASTAQR